MYIARGIRVIKMTTRLSYHAWITALITFDVLLLTTSASYSEDLPEFVESRQLRRNLAHSKFKNRLGWLKNYTLKPLGESEGTKPPPVWEKEIKIQSNEPSEEDDAWDKEMKKLTHQQLNKWKFTDEKSSEEPKTEADRHEDESGVKSEVNISDIDFSSGDKSADARRTFGSKFDFEKFYNSSSEPGVSQATELTQDERIELNQQSGRWGMSMKSPPADFLKELSKADDRDENKFKESQTRVGSGAPTKAEKTPKRHRWDEGDEGESEKEASTVEMEDNKLSKSVNNFSNDRWGMSVTSPPLTFLREILSNHLQPISVNNSESGSSSAESIGSADGKVLIHKILDSGLGNFKKDIRTGDANRTTTALSKETRTLMPIFFVGPSFWTLKLPTDSLQPLGNISNELTRWEKNKDKDRGRDEEDDEDATQTSSLRNFRLMNTKIIIGEMGAP